MNIADKLIQVAENEQKVYDAGYTKGINDGGYSEGMEAGKKTEYDRFWDAYQNYGKRTEYYSCFGGLAWNDETFKPKYDLAMAYSARQAFIYNGVKDITTNLKNCGVVLDTKGVTDNTNMFYAASTRTLPTLDFTSVTTTGYTFTDCMRLESIEKIIIGNKYPGSTTMFHNCKKLKDIVFEGEFVNNFGMGACILLSRASIENIIGCLSNDATGKTLTLSQTAVNNAFTNYEWSSLISGKTNWTFSLV